jgi:hypothetical protein
MLKKKFETKRERVTGKRIIWRNEELHGLFSSPDVASSN